MKSFSHWLLNSKPDSKAINITSQNVWLQAVVNHQAYPGRRHLHVYFITYRWGTVASRRTQGKLQEFGTQVFFKHLWISNWFFESHLSTVVSVHSAGNWPIRDMLHNSRLQPTWLLWNLQEYYMKAKTEWVPTVLSEFSSYTQDRERERERETHIYIHTHTHTYIHTYIHTYKLTYIPTTKFEQCVSYNLFQ